MARSLATNVGVSAGALGNLAGSPVAANAVHKSALDAVSLKNLETTAFVTGATPNGRAAAADGAISIARAHGSSSERWI